MTHQTQSLRLIETAESTASATKVDKSRAVIRLLAEMLEENAFSLAGEIDSTQVAHIIRLSQQVADVAERLRPLEK